MFLLHVIGYDPGRAFEVTRILCPLDEERPEGPLEHWLYDLAHRHSWSEDRDRCVRQYVKNAKTVAKCRNRCEKGTVASVVTEGSLLNVWQYPSVSSLILGHYQRGEEITPICYCVKQQSGM